MRKLIDQTNIKKVSLAATATLFMAAYSHILGAAPSNTAFKALGRMEVHSSKIIDLHPQGSNWGLQGCPSADHARIYPSNSAYDQLYALSVAAKFSGKRVMIRAECSATNPQQIIEVKVIYVE